MRGGFHDAGHRNSANDLELPKTRSLGLPEEVVRLLPSSAATHMSLPRSSCSRDAVTTAEVSSHHRAHEEHVFTDVMQCMCSAPLCPRTLVEHVAFHTDNMRKDVCRCAEARDNFDTTSVPMEYGGAAATSEEKVQRFGKYYQRHSC